MASHKEAAPRKTGVAGWNQSEGTGRDSSRGGRGKRLAADRRRRIATVAFVVACCAICLWCAIPVQENITRGLMFKGGTANTMTAAEEVSADDLSLAVSTIKGRLASVGVPEYDVSAEGSDSVVIRLPWNVEGKRIAESVGGAGVLEFVRMDEIGDADALTLLNAGAEDVTLKQGTYSSFLDNSNVTSCETTMVSEGVYAVTINFDDEGAKVFADVTEELAEDYGSIAIVVDGHVMASPSVSEKIEGGQVSISGGFSEQEAGALKAVLESQTLPTNLELASSEEIGALAGDQVPPLLAAGAAVAAVVVAALAYVRMRKAGLLVLGSELVLAVLMLGLMAVASRIEVYVLTVPALLGGACACACGVVASWMVVDRFRSLVKEGKSVRGSSLSAVTEALNPFAMPVAIVGVVGLVTLFLPIAWLREAGLSVVLGIIASVMAVLLFEVPLLRVLAAGSMQENPTSWGLEAPSNDSTDEAPSAQET